jgi:hypothetical protein
MVRQDVPERRWQALPPNGGIVAQRRIVNRKLLAAGSGLINGRVVRRFNCFYDTTAEAKVAKDLFIQSVNFLARKDVTRPGKRQGFLF